MICKKCGKKFNIEYAQNKEKCYHCGYPAIVLDTCKLCYLNPNGISKKEIIELEKTATIATEYPMGTLCVYEKQKEFPCHI